MNTWQLWALGAAFFAGLTAILAKLGVAGVNSHVATAIRTTVVLVLTWGIAWRVTDGLSLGEIPRRTWGLLALSGAATGLSWLCYFRALQLGDVSRVAAVDKLGVVFAIVLAGLVLHERITWQHWLGGGLIVAGVLVLGWRNPA